MRLGAPFVSLVPGQGPRRADWRRLARTNAPRPARWWRVIRIRHRSPNSRWRLGFRQSSLHPAHLAQAPATRLRHQVFGPLPDMLWSRSPFEVSADSSPAPVSRVGRSCASKLRSCEHSLLLRATTAHSGVGDGPSRGCSAHPGSRLLRDLTASDDLLPAAPPRAGAAASQCCGTGLSDQRQCPLPFSIRLPDRGVRPSWSPAEIQIDARANTSSCHPTALRPIPSHFNGLWRDRVGGDAPATLFDWAD
jgi:hypothetical protein